MNKDSKIYVAGHRGMVGSAVVRALQHQGFANLITRTRQELDLTRQAEVERFFSDARPDYVFLAAARVGGIMANKTYRADFIRTNLQVQTNVIDSAWRSGVQGLLFFSSSCVYPRVCPQPMKEEHLWSGLLEPTNEPYAVAKLAGMSMCRAYNDQHGTRFSSVVPSNLYGINDNYDPQQSHVMAALIAKFHTAKVNDSPSVVLWGTGRPRREMMCVDDAAEAAVFVMQHDPGGDPINVGLGYDWTIAELAEVVRKVTGFGGDIEFDTSKPDGVAQKLLDVSRLHGMGWEAKTSLEAGVAEAYQWYLRNAAKRGS